VFGIFEITSVNEEIARSAQGVVEETSITVFTLVVILWRKLFQAGKVLIKTLLEKFESLTGHALLLIRLVV
jgi:hypothetical protein